MSSIWCLLRDLVSILYQWLDVAFLHVFPRPVEDTLIVPGPGQKTAALPFLFRLPQELLVSISEKWLDIYDVARVDAALTNQKYRPQWLQCLQQMKSISVNGHSFNAGGETQRYRSDKLKSNSMLNWICHRQIYIESIDLGELDDEFVESLQLPSVQKLSLMDASYESIIHLVDSMPILRSVKIWYPINSRKVVGRGVRHVAIKCSCLEYFTLSAPMTSETKGDLLFLLSQCLQLKELTLGSFSLDSYTDNDLQRLQSYASLFTNMASHGTRRRMTVTGFTTLLRGCSQLRSLSYSGFNDGGTVLLCAAQSCPMLAIIHLDSISLEACVVLSQCCQRLKHLSLSLWNRIQATVACLEALKQIDSLESLNLSSCSVTDEGLEVLGGFPRLKTLRLNESKDGGPIGQLWTGAGFKVFAASSVNQSIEHLDLGPLVSPLFDFTALATGIAACHQLRKLEFHGKGVCTDEFLEIVAAGCPLIEELGVHHGPPLTMEGAPPPPFPIHSCTFPS